MSTTVTRLKTSSTLNKSRPHPGDGVSAFLCTFLDDHGVKPEQGREPLGQLGMPRGVAGASVLDESES
jgi:hypothetical protein